MSTSDPSELAAQARPTEPDSVVTFPAHHDGEDGMGLRSMTVERYEEIRRRLADGRGIREIARALGCSRDTVREDVPGAGYQLVTWGSHPWEKVD